MLSNSPMAPMALEAVTPPAPPSAITKPFKPLLRRTNLSGTTRTRDEAGLDLDSDVMSIPSSPSKRARTVTFNPLVQEQIFSSSPLAEVEKDIDEIRIQARRALEEHIRGGEEEGYDAIKEMFTARSKLERDEEARRSSDMRMHLLALTNYVSMLGRSCSGLVRSILACDWIGRDDAFVKIYVQFLGNLASAQGAYVDSILRMLVDKFTSLRISHGRLMDCPIVNRERLTSRIHIALKYLLKLIPSASGTLVPILSSKFPLSDETKRVHMAYVDNLIKLVDYAPELKSEIFALTTKSVVEIDVSMQVDLDDMDDDVAAAIVQAISLRNAQAEDDDEDETEDEDDSDAESMTSDESIDDNASRIKIVQEKVEKMDAVLDTLFSVYAPYFENAQSDLAMPMFRTLLAHFRNIILPTYRSRHTQFILFHFAQSSTDLVDEFAGECVELAFKSGLPAALRQSAAAYLASFVSRGARVLPHVVQDVFDYIGSNLDKVRNDNESTCRGPDLNSYGDFYATTQALLYIFCFRWRDLIVSPSPDDADFDDEDLVGRDLEWRTGVKELLMRTIYSKLNPLKICAPAIVQEFAKIAHHLRFMYVYPLIETNKRVRLSQFVRAAAHGGNGALRDTGATLVRSGAADGEQETWHQLDAYFPFDPYQLPRSKKWVEEDYVSWKGIPGLNRDDDDDTTDGGVDLDEDDDVDEEEEDVNDTATEDDDDL